MAPAAPLPGKQFSISLDAPVTRFGGRNFPWDISSLEGPFKVTDAQSVYLFVVVKVRATTLSSLHIGAETGSVSQLYF